MTSWMFGETYSVGINAGLDARYYLSDTLSLIFGVETYSSARKGQMGSFTLLFAPRPNTMRDPTEEVFSTWRARASVGLSWTYKNAFTLNVAAAYEQNYLFAGHYPRFPKPATERDSVFTLGSVQTLALRPLPLLQVHITQWLSVDAYAAGALHIRMLWLRGLAMAGVTFAF